MFIAWASHTNRLNRWLFWNAYSRSISPIQEIKRRCRVVFCSACKVKHPVRRAQSPRVVRLQALPNKEMNVRRTRGCVASGLMCGKVRIVPGNRCDSYSGAIQPPLTGHQRVCVCVWGFSTAQMLQITLTAAGEAVGLSHKINTEPPPQGLIQNPKGPGYIYLLGIVNEHWWGRETHESHGRRSCAVNFIYEQPWGRGTPSGTVAGFNLFPLRPFLRHWCSAENITDFMSYPQVKSFLSRSSGLEDQSVILIIPCNNSATAS